MEGELQNYSGKHYLYLIDMDVKKIVDSFQVKDGVFNHKFSLDYPKHYRLQNQRAQYQVRDMKELWLEPSLIQIFGDSDFLGNVDVSGSRSNEVFYTYKQYLDSIDTQVRILKEEYAVNGDPNLHIKIKAILDSLKATNHPNPQMFFIEHPELYKTQKQSQIEARIDILEGEVPPRVFKFLMDHSDSFVALSVLHDECYLNRRHLNKKEINSIFSAFPIELKNTEKGNEIRIYLSLPDVPQIGDHAIDFAQLTPTGDTVRLSDLLGNYLLVDFWASNCGPCRAKNKQIRELYSKYHKSGLEILGVSGDTDKNNWVAAISEDSMNWKNISDLNGWKNQAFLLNDIKSIPHYLLLNSEGVIISKSQNWAYIEGQIHEIFN